MAWFQFPRGVEAITVLQQEFRSVVTDAKGNGLFAAPDHFVPHILAVPGFQVVAEPEDAPEDLTTSGMQTNEAIAKLGADNAALKSVIQELNEALTSLQAQYTAQTSALNEANATIEAHEAELARLRDLCEDNDIEHAKE
jgi:hypothetical protein